MVSYHRASREDLAAVAEFAASLNVRTDHRIGYLGDNPAEISRELLEYRAIDDAFLARGDGDLVGFMAMDIDEALNRSYLYGPLVDHEEWDDVAQGLVQRCLDLVPDNASGQFEMFFDLGNTNVARLGRALGFETYKDVRTLRFDRTALGDLESGGASPVDVRHHENVAALHDRLFPDTYLPGRRMIKGLRDDKACFVRTEGGEVLGYIYLEIHEATGSASLDFIGTAEGARGRGVGADLVRTGLHWMFGFDSVSVAWLVVDEDNVGAQRLYERLGWSVVHRLTSLRRAGRPTAIPTASNAS